MKKDVTFASLIHELRNPLSSLMGSLELIREGLKKKGSVYDSIKEVLEIADDSGEFL
jgi:signal transduction histidine kinase